MNPEFHRFRGTGEPPPGKAPVRRPGQRGRYLADPGLVRAVNTALAVEQPLLLTGEPGSGKSDLAWAVATELGLGDVLLFSTRSDHRGPDLLYSFDHLRRLFDANRQRLEPPEEYIDYHALGEAIKSAERRVVLIDEIDKAPRDFPNDLLNELEQMTFTVRETRVTYPLEGQAARRPVVIITSNNERNLPDAFMRRCVFHHLKLPGRERYLQILHERLAHLQVSAALAEAAVARYGQLRHLEVQQQGLEKRPATAELLAWVRVLQRAGLSPQHLAQVEELQDWLGVLVKNQDDLALVQRARPEDWERAAQRLQKDPDWNQREPQR